MPNLQLSLKKNSLMNKLTLSILSILFLFKLDAQQPINSGSILDSVSSYQYEQDYATAIKLLNKIHFNDTNFETAMITLSYCHIEDSNFTEAYKACERGLTVERPKERMSLLINKTASLRGQKKFNEALKLARKSYQEFPNSDNFLYQQALTHYYAEQFDSAEYYFIKTVEYNPFNTHAHYFIGDILARQNRPIPAIMALTSHVWMNSKNPSAPATIGLLYNLLMNEYDPGEDAIKYKGKENHYKAMEANLKSNFGANSKYLKQTKVKIKNEMIGQWHFVLANLKYVNKTDSYYDQVYIPFFEEVMKRDFYDDMVYFSFTTYADADGFHAVNKYLMKKQKKLAEFLEFAIEKVNDPTKNRKTDLYGSEKVVPHYYYHTGELKSVGKSNSLDKHIGKWYYFHGNGIQGGSENYNSNGERNGLDTEYYLNGELNLEINYKDGKLDGLYKIYYKNGVPMLEYNIKDNSIDGTAYFFDATGHRFKELVYVDKKLNGKEVQYYFNGQIRYEANNKNGLYDGASKGFYFDGTKRYECTYDNGNYEGKYTYYHSNGKVKTEGEYKNGKMSGEWKDYYNTGQLKSSSHYSDKGLPIDTWTTYHPNGKIEYTEVYGEEGKKTGKHKEYDIDGILHFEYSYDLDEVNGITYYNKAGEVVSTSKLKKGKLEFKGYWPDGKTLKVSGAWEDGERVGKWKFYNVYGTLTDESNYEEDHFKGEQITYHDNGKIESKFTYEENPKTDLFEINGLYQRFYPNGKLKRFGYYEYGNMVGHWYTYNEKGNVIEKNYYMDDEQYGYQYYCRNDGSLDEVFKYFQNKHKEAQYFITDEDYKGNFFKLEANYVENELPKGSGTYQHYIMDKITFECPYIHGKLHGEAKWYDGTGKVRYEGSFVNGERDGKFIGYDIFGNINGLKYYKEGNLVGDNTSYYRGKMNFKTKYNDNSQVIDKEEWYYKDGKTELTSYFSNGHIDSTYYYAPSGELYFVKYFYYGYLVAYSHPGKDGKLVDRIKLDKGAATLKAYYQNGQLSYEAEYKNGEINGKGVKYYPNGKKWEEYYCENDEYEGTVKRYHPNGKLSFEGNYFNGQRDSICTYYYDNGQISIQGNYELDDAEGEFIYYERSGKIKDKVIFHQDILYSREKTFKNKVQ